MRHPSLTNFFPWIQKLHCRQQTRLMQLNKGDKTRPKDKRYQKIDRQLTKYKCDLTVSHVKQFVFYVHLLFRNNWQSAPN